MKFIEELNKLVKEYPNAEIRANISEDTCFWEHSSLLVGESGFSVSVESLTVYEGKFYDYDDLIEEFICDYSYKEEYKNHTDKQFESICKLEASTYKFENIIIIKISDC